MIVTMLLVEDQPPFRVLWEGELDAAPPSGEPIGFGGRQYMVMERSWRLGTAPKETPEDPDVWQISVGLLLQQIGGPPHVAIVRLLPETQQ